MTVIDYARRLTHLTLDALLPRRRVLAEIREQWGKPGSKHQAFAERWFELTRGASACVDDKTWDDLEMPRVFADLDTTVTPLGSQALYRQLREYVDDPAELAARHAMHVHLKEQQALRERLQSALLPVRDSAHAFVVDALFADALEPPARPGALSLWSTLSCALLVAAVAGWMSAWWWFALIPVNVAILYRLSWRSLRETETLNGCLYLLGAAEALCAVDSELAPLQQLRTERGARDAARRALRPMRIGKWAPFWVMPLLNLVCLLEVIMHQWSIRRFDHVRHRLHRTFALVGNIDAALALASALTLHPRHCHPDIVDHPRLEVIDAIHPLLPAGVTNSIQLDGGSALITGSNMAGKTTFAKMLALNAILGRTVGFCLATRAVLPRLPVMAVVQGRHAVETGKSRYFAEIEAIGNFLTMQRQHGGGLFLLDEPFSGTNTTERIAIACAVLRALGEGSLVLVTTHDVELQAMLGERYALYHFQEDPAVEGFFDYRLRTGPATARNAIRLLAHVGFPPDVIREAMACMPTAPDTARREMLDSL